MNEPQLLEPHFPLNQSYWPLLVVAAIVCILLLLLLIKRWLFRPIVKKEIHVAAAKSVDKGEYIQYLKKLEDVLSSNKEPNITGVYVSMSYILRRYIEETRHVQAVTMTKEELDKLHIGEKFDDVIEACYAAEFSKDRGSKEECQAVLKTAQEFISS